MAKSISSYDDIIDSRDVIERIDELTNDREIITDSLEEAKEAFAAVSVANRKKKAQRINTVADLAAAVAAKQAVNDATKELSGWDESDDAEELKKLKELESACENEGSWQNGMTLINDNYFEDYAQELASDIGAISSDMQWPLNFIDWPAASEALKSDYTVIEWDAVTFYTRD